MRLTSRGTFWRLIKNNFQCLIKSDWENSKCEEFCVNTLKVGYFKEPKILKMMLCLLSYSSAHAAKLIILGFRFFFYFFFFVIL